MRLPLSPDVMRIALPALLVALGALPVAAETWQARDVVAAERYRAEERERAERYRADVEAKAGARPVASGVGEIVAEKAGDLGEDIATWLGDRIAAELGAIFGREEDDASPQRDLGPGEEPRGIREWLSRERQRARELVEGDEAERAR